MPDKKGTPKKRYAALLKQLLPKLSNDNDETRKSVIEECVQFVRSDKDLSKFYEKFVREELQGKEEERIKFAITDNYYTKVFLSGLQAKIDDLYQKEITKTNYNPRFSAAPAVCIAPVQHEPNVIAEEKARVLQC